MGSTYIDGVYNYCDRWCERCPLTERCRLFATERHIEQHGHFSDSAAFWKSLGLDMSDEFDEFFSDEDDDDGFITFEPEPEDELDDDDPGRLEAALARFERNQHPLAAFAKTYGLDSRDWLGEHAERAAKLPAAEPDRVTPGEAVEVLYWYGLQIGAKLHRALSEREYTFAGEDDDESWDTGSDWQDADDEEHDEIVKDAARMDREGSCKVALIGIERSIGAWTVLRNAVPEQDAAIRDFQRRLARLRKAIDDVVPGARTFIRVGFDDGTIPGDA